MAYASPATYIERDNVLYPNIHHHRDTNIHTNKTIATNIVSTIGGMGLRTPPVAEGGEEGTIHV